MIGKISSLIIIIFYIIGGYAMGGGSGAIQAFLFVLIPFFCIWFGNQMGSAIGQKTTGTFFHPPITKTSPGCIVSFLGWVFLLSPFIVALFYALFN